MMTARLATLGLLVLLAGTAFAADTNANDITDASVDTVDIKVNSIRNVNIRDNTIESNKIKDLTIAARDIKDGAITSGKLAPQAVKSSKLAKVTTYSSWAAEDDYYMYQCGVSSGNPMYLTGSFCKCLNGCYVTMSGSVPGIAADAGKAYCQCKKSGSLCAKNDHVLVTSCLAA